MRFYFLSFCGFLLFPTPLVRVQQVPLPPADMMSSQISGGTAPSSSQATSSQAGAAATAESAQIRQLGNPRGNDAQALRDDVKRMRALVSQMETNLAFVDVTQSPLKHQFQLDIDMWNILINQMERRSYSNSR